jgi:hypothetical protein
MGGETLEGWAVDTAGGWLDHTFVHCPDNNLYFNCWGGHTGNNLRKICQGNGSYATANCYRIPVTIAGTTFPDTAGIGVYLIDGVCHQSANCFLLSAGVKLDSRVKGYDLSTWRFGTYGRKAAQWYQKIYLPCRQKYAEYCGTPEMSPWDEQGANAETIRRILQIHAEAEDPNSAVVSEMAYLVTQNTPDVDPEIFRAAHHQYLQQVDEVVAAGLTGEPLVERLKSLDVAFQHQLAQLLGADLHERLTGVPGGQEFSLCDPELRDIAGKSPD